jgi:hypothetical protein
MLIYQWLGLAAIAGASTVSATNASRKETSMNNRLALLLVVITFLPAGAHAALWVGDLSGLAQRSVNPSITGAEEVRFTWDTSNIVITTTRTALIGSAGPLSSIEAAGLSDAAGSASIEHDFPIGGANIARVAGSTIIDSTLSLLPGFWLRPQPVTLQFQPVDQISGGGPDWVWAGPGPVTFTASAAPMPEPGILALFGAGLAVTVWARRTQAQVKPASHAGL